MGEGWKGNVCAGKNQLFGTLEYVPNKNMRQVPLPIIKNISITQEISSPLYTRKTIAGAEGEGMSN